MLRKTPIMKLKGIFQWVRYPMYQKIDKRFNLFDQLFASSVGTFMGSKIVCFKMPHK